MSADHESVDIREEVLGLADCLERGDARASVHLARLFVADERGALQPFAAVLAGRLCDHLSRFAELGVTDSWTALEDEVYGLMQAASIDWARLGGRPANPRDEG